MSILSQILSSKNFRRQNRESKIAQEAAPQPLRRSAGSRLVAPVHRCGALLVYYITLNNLLIFFIGSLITCVQFPPSDTWYRASKCRTTLLSTLLAVIIVLFQIEIDRAVESSRDAYLHVGHDVAARCRDRSYCNTGFGEEKGGNRNCEDSSDHFDVYRGLSPRQLATVSVTAIQSLTEIRARGSQAIVGATSTAVQSLTEVRMRTFVNGGSV
ncbi:hypothetical protein C8R48DRAFT_764050 [Suillus tomentosus]|nr:hypothetical protein C8R48DRAFT_764050 [Suillus tomentosus]